jgi:hypothetical protein
MHAEESPLVPPDTTRVASNVEQKQQQEQQKQPKKQKLQLTSARCSLSVGSTMRVPGTGHDMVGAWKP